MKKIICLLIVALTFPSMQVLADFGPPPEAEEFTKKTIQLFSNGQIDEAISMLQPSMLPENPSEIGSTIGAFLGQCLNLDLHYTTCRNRVNKD
jgi:hypothetical protein